MRQQGGDNGNGGNESARRLGRGSIETGVDGSNPNARKTSARRLGRGSIETGRRTLRVAPCDWSARRLGRGSIETEALRTAYRDAQSQRDDSAEDPLRPANMFRSLDKSPSARRLGRGSIETTHHISAVSIILTAARRLGRGSIETSSDSTNDSLVSLSARRLGRGSIETIILNDTGAVVTSQRDDSAEDPLRPAFRRAVK